MTYFRILLSLFFIIASVASQESKISVTQIEEAYNNINFERAISLSTLALEKDDGYSPFELVEIYKFRAFAFFNIGNEKESASSFLSALSINPILELDEISVSPKIISFFNSLKVKNENPVINETNSIETRYLLVEDPRPNSALRSIFLPGWGQYYKGEENKAYIVFSAFAVNSAALVISLIKEKSSHDDYLNSRESNEIKSKYNTYNTWYKTRQILTYSEIIIWTYAFADALWSPVKKDNIISVHLSPNTLSLTYQF